MAVYGGAPAGTIAGASCNDLPILKTINPSGTSTVILACPFIIMKKPLSIMPLVAALFSLSLPAQGADYHVVVPAPGKVASYASIKLELNPANLPVGVLGEPYAGFDFNMALRVTGDPELDLSQVSWSRYSGEPPDGLSLARDGSLSGTPTEAGSPTFQALAKYKTKTAVGTYVVDVETQTKIMD